MKIKYIIDDIDDLISKALQDYLYLLVKDDNWQEDLYLIAKDAVDNNSFKSKYIDVYNELDMMEDKSQYKTADMDISLIVSILYYRDDFRKISDKTKVALFVLSKDRNKEGHSNRNESSEELYERGLVSLRDLKDFVLSVKNNEFSIKLVERNEYRNNYIKLIDDKRSALYEAYSLIQKDKIVEKSIKKDIQRILDSNDRSQAWIAVSEQYFQNWARNKDAGEFIHFITAAADAGIEQAYSKVAEYYFFTVKDYDLAEKYLSFMYMNKGEQRYDAKSMMKLAYIYLHKLSKKHGDGYAVIKSLIDDGYNIQKTSDGTKYVLISNKDGKINYSIDIPLDNLPKKKASELSCHSAGNLSGTKKTRLGRVHKKKTDTQTPDQEVIK